MKGSGGQGGEWFDVDLFVSRRRIELGAGSGLVGYVLPLFALPPRPQKYSSPPSFLSVVLPSFPFIIILLKRPIPPCLTPFFFALKTKTQNQNPKNSLSLALHSPSLTIHLTDLPHLLPTLKSNISLNAPLLLSSVYPSVLSWGEKTPMPPPDVLLAADCVYFEPAFPLLLETMRTLIGEKTVCYFCFVKRRRADVGFLRRLRRIFDVREVKEDVVVGERGWEEVGGEVDGEEGHGEENREVDGSEGREREVDGGEDGGEDKDGGRDAERSDHDKSAGVKPKRRKHHIFM